MEPRQEGGRVLQGSELTKGAHIGLLRDILRIFGVVNDYPRRRLDRIAGQLDDAAVGAHIPFSSRPGQGSQFVVVADHSGSCLQDTTIG